MVGDDGQIYLSGLPLEGSCLFSGAMGCSPSVVRTIVYRLKAKTSHYHGGASCDR